MAQSDLPELGPHDLQRTPPAQEHFVVGPRQQLDARPVQLGDVARLFLPCLEHPTAQRGQRVQVSTPVGVDGDRVALAQPRHKASLRRTLGEDESLVAPHGDLDESAVARLVEVKPDRLRWRQFGAHEEDREVEHEIVLAQPKVLPPRAGRGRTGQRRHRGGLRGGLQIRGLVVLALPALQCNRPPEEVELGEPRKAPAHGRDGGERVSGGVRARAALGELVHDLGEYVIAVHEARVPCRTRSGNGSQHAQRPPPEPADKLVYATEPPEPADKLTYATDLSRIAQPTAHQDGEEEVRGRKRR